MTAPVSTTVNTPRFRASWPKLFKAEKNDLNGKNEFSVVAIFPLGTDLSALKKACSEAVKKKFKDVKPPNLRSPFRKCSEKWKEVTDEATGQTKTVKPNGFEDGDAIWITFKTENRPGVVDANVQDILEERQLYAGCWCIAQVNAGAYGQKGNNGVSLYLNHVQKVADGDPLGSQTKPSDAFVPVASAGVESAEDVFA